MLLRPSSGPHNQFSSAHIERSVFGDEVKLVLVMEGDSVTLHTDITQIQRDDQILWTFEHSSRLAEIIKKDQINFMFVKNDVQMLNTDKYSEEMWTYLFLVCVAGVFGDEVKSVSVMEGDSVTLYTDITHIQTDQEMVWVFGPKVTLIARIYMKIIDMFEYEIFEDRLNLDNQTGSLTITNITITNSGLYELQIFNNRHSSKKRFNVTVNARLLVPVPIRNSSSSSLSSSKMIFSLLLLFVLNEFCVSGVFGADGDEVKSVSVMEGDSVTLHTDITQIQRDDHILWMFGPQETRIAENYKKIIDMYNSNEIFRDRLKLDSQTGSLTITNITITHTGLYKLTIISNRGTSYKRFNVIVYGYLPIPVITRISNSSNCSTLSERSSNSKCLLLLCSVLNVKDFGVDGDEVKSVSVVEGDSVTLHTNITEIQTDDQIVWMFGPQDTLIAEISKKIIDMFDSKEIFGDRLKLDSQTGSLTITNIKMTHTGLYKLQIFSNRGNSYKRFNVTVYVKNVRDVDYQDKNTYSCVVSNPITNQTQHLNINHLCQMCLEESGVTALIVLILLSGVLLVFVSSRVIHCYCRKYQQTKQEGVFVVDGDGVKSVSRDDHILQIFGPKGTLIAEIYKKSIDMYDSNEIFRDRLKLDNQTGSLTITNITITHTGLYKLQIISNRGTSYKRFNVTFYVCFCVSGVSGVDGDEVKSVSVMEGDSVTLHTDITQIQTDDEIVWRFGPQDTLIAEISKKIIDMFDSKEIFGDSLKLESQTGSLTITNIKITHTGLYKLHIFSNRGNSYKRFKVTVYAPLPIPVIRNSSQCSSSESSSSSKCVLLCSVMNVRDVSLSWYKGNSLLSNISVSDLNISLSLPLEVEYQDTNTYRCVVSNPITNQTQLLNITHLCQTSSEESGFTALIVLILISGVLLVFVSSRVIHCYCRKYQQTKQEGVFGVDGDEVKSVSVMEGDFVTLHTDITEVQKDHLILWMFGPQKTRIAQIYKKSIDMYNNETFGDRLKLDNQTGSLNITNITITHTGLYKLQIILHQVFVTNATYLWLHINYIDGVFGVDGDEVKSVSVMEGDSVTLHTDITEIQRDDQIVWMFGPKGTPIAGLFKKSTYKDDSNEIFGDRLKLDSQTGSLIITNITTTNSGIYKLTIISKRGDSYKRFKVTVYAPLPVPLIIRDSSQCSSSSLSLCSKCVVLCSVLNVRDVSLSWYKGNSLLSSISVSDLKISLSLPLEDKYQDTNTYRCVVNNPLTNQTQHLNINELYQMCSVVFVVDDDEVKSVLVMEGDSVTLHTDYITEIQRDDHIRWTFEHTSRLAEIIKRDQMNFTFVKKDGIFRDHLQMNNQTGSLTINKIRTEHTGLYKLQISRDDIAYKIFTVTVYAQLPIPVITRKSSSSERSSVSNCSLLCSVLNVRDVSLSWYKGNSLLSIINVSDFNIRLSLSLEVDYQDTNTYRCVLNNTITNQTQHLNIKDSCLSCSATIQNPQWGKIVISLVLVLLIIAAFGVIYLFYFRYKRPQGKYYHFFLLQNIKDL
ncbi:uncharacterized protein, partial [Misgurnus anguillicaudatus]|uniref:uncharacterized protein n=1 Tax=Misgurnus anguillicaudatus TaxID=75329 RepID=UPI003CCF599C